VVSKLNIETFDYDDIRLVPKKCIVGSRSEVSTKSKLGGREFELPVIPANMSTIIDSNLAEWLASNGYFYVMHRFDVDPVEFTRDFQSRGLYSSISLGIKAVDYEDVNRLRIAELTPEYITIDVAHGHSESVIKMVEYVRENLPESFVIAGNVGSVEGALALEAAGAHAVKVGIGPGFVCTTAPNTGFGTRNWQLSAIHEISKALTKSALIADGGIRHYGDIAKSLAFGADFIMIGGMFAGHDESPGKPVEDEAGNRFKEFFGSASEFQKGESKNVEGKKELIPVKGPIADTMSTIRENLQSSVSYAGGNELKSLRDVEYVIIK